MRLIYLAGPYSDPKESVREERVNEFIRALAFFTDQSHDLCLYSPIVQWHEVAKQYKLPHDFQYWAQRDFFMIQKSFSLWVLTIPGWDKSYGVGQEMEFANSIERDIVYVIPDPEFGYVLTDAKPTHTNPSA